MRFFGTISFPGGSIRFSFNNSVQREQYIFPLWPEVLEHYIKQVKFSISGSHDFQIRRKLVLNIFLTMNGKLIFFVSATVFIMLTFLVRFLILFII